MTDHKLEVVKQGSKEIHINRFEGKVISEITYHNGQKHGEYKHYSNTGDHLLEEGYYCLGKKDGVIKKYRFGELKAEIPYYNGEIDGIVKNYETFNGINYVQLEERYHLGNLTNAKKYRPDGSLEGVYEYDENRNVNYRELYNEKGQATERMIGGIVDEFSYYDNGKLKSISNNGKITVKVNEDGSRVNLDNTNSQEDPLVVERIRANKARLQRNKAVRDMQGDDISGVVVADKLAEEKRSGAIKKDITPKSDLPDYVKAKMLSERQKQRLKERG